MNNATSPGTDGPGGATKLSAFQVLAVFLRLGLTSFGGPVAHLGYFRDEFVARRTELDRRAAQHRLHSIAENDPRAIASRTALPVFGLSGWLDPIVPWPWVRRWLRKNCPSLRDYNIVWRADHNVLSTAPKEAAERVWAWISPVTMDEL